jgi:RHS repeat-associated protein
MGLNCFGARYCDAEIGKWIGTDPAERHYDSYQYGGNNPTNRIDPDGNIDVEVGGNVSGSIG